MSTPLIYGVALPALAAGVVWGIGWRLWRRSAEPMAGGAWSGAAAAALACAAGAFALWGWPGVPPRLAEGWLPFLAVAGGVAGLAANRWRRARLPLRGVMAALAVWAALGPRRAGWPAGEAVAWHATLMAGAFVVHASIDRVAARRPGPGMAMALWVWCAGLAGALALTGSLKYGQLAGLPAAALGAAAVAAAWKPALSLANGTAFVLAPWNAALLLCGYFYSDLPAAAAIPLAAAPLGLWFGETAAVTRRPAWAAAGARILAVAVPVAVGAAIAAWPTLFPAPGPEGPDYDYGYGGPIPNNVPAHSVVTINSQNFL